MNSGIYAIVNIVTSRMYIGSTKDFGKRCAEHTYRLRRNCHTNIRMQTDFNQYGEESFVFIPMFTTSEEHLLTYEQLALYATEYCNIDFYNERLLATGGDHISKHPQKEAIVARIRETMNNTISTMSEEQRKLRYGKHGQANGMYGKTHSSEARRRISEANLGNTYAEGSIRSDIQRQQLSEAASLRIGELNPFYGKTHTAETKLLMSKKRKGCIPGNSKHVEIDGVVYRSASEAGRQLGIPNVTISHRCNNASEKFKNYRYLD